MCFCYYLLICDLYDDGFKNLVYVASRWPLMFVDGLNKTTKQIRMHGRLSEFRFEFEIS